MRRHRLLSSAGLRFAAVYFALYLLSTAAMLVLIYWIEWSTANANLDMRVDDRLAWLDREFDEGGVARVAEGIRARIEAQVRGRHTLYRLAQGGRVLAANFESGTAPIDVGRQTLAVRNERDGAEKLVPWRARTVRLAGDVFVTVGVESEQLEQTRQLFIRVGIGALIGSLLMAPAIGFFMSRNLLHRLDLLNQTIASIMAGQWSRRVELRGADDEFDELGAKLNEMLETIEALMGDLRSVANDVAHDLRTPLSRLRLKLAELRERFDGSDPAAGEIDEAIEECGRIIETFNSILKLSEIETERTQAGFSDCNLSDIVATIGEAYAGIAEEEGRAFRVDVRQGVHVHGDKPLLLQMLSNLVENAFKHTPAAAAVFLRLTIEGEGEQAVIVVEDRGPGIPAAARSHVFDRFFRLEQSRTTPGSGLGLSLVAAIARLHKIQIALGDAEPGLRVRLAFA